MTRLSIGLQTADDALLPAIGRRHDAAHPSAFDGECKMIRILPRPTNGFLVQPKAYEFGDR